MEKTTRAPALKSTKNLAPGYIVRVDDQVLTVAYVDMRHTEWVVHFRDTDEPPIGVTADHLDDPMWELVL